jgi:hypothetical protein
LCRRSWRPLSSQSIRALRRRRSSTTTRTSSGAPQRGAGAQSKSRAWASIKCAAKRPLSHVVHTARCTPPAAHCPLHTARCTLPAAHCPLHTARCTLPVRLHALLAPSLTSLNRVHAQVACSCGMLFCFKCSQEAHFPLSCAQLKAWETKAANDSETAKWIKVRPLIPCRPSDVSWNHPVHPRRQSVAHHSTLFISIHSMQQYIQIRYRHTHRSERHRDTPTPICRSTRRSAPSASGRSRRTVAATT